MIKLLVLFIGMLAIFDLANSNPVLKSAALENEGKIDETTDVTYDLDNDELKSLVKFLEENPQFFLELINREDEEEDETASISNNVQEQDVNNKVDHLTRNRRRLSVFKNIYHQCRITKRREKDYCLQIANLYQNVKGFHGI